MDVAVIPTDDVPTRFASRTLYAENFVLAMRAGHPLQADRSLDRYCDARHLVVSLSGDPRGFVDEALAQTGRSRRVVATVPNFMFALAVIAESDLVCALPRRFAAVHAGRFGVVAIDPPFALKDFRLDVIVPQAALLDAGVAWLVARVLATSRSGQTRSAGKVKKKGR
jgi:DNA-binding transcriptional LysR family regulator